MVAIAQLKQDFLEKLKSVSTTEELSLLDQSQIYLLSIPSLFNLVIDKVVNLNELSETNELCFIRLQKFLIPEILTLLRANKISLQALSSIELDTIHIITAHVENILSDDSSLVLQGILVNQTSLSWNTTQNRPSISPWNKEVWNKYQVLNPDQITILDDSALIYPSVPLITFADMIADYIAETSSPVFLPEYAKSTNPSSSLAEPSSHLKINDSPFGKINDIDGQGESEEEYVDCSESMLSTSSSPPLIKISTKLEVSHLIQILEPRDHTSPKLKGDTLYYLNRVRVKIPETYDFSTEGSTKVTRKI